MPDLPIPNNEPVTVMVAQTTFAVLRIPGKSIRIDYLDKVEVRLKPGMRGKFRSYTEHPLLLSYSSRLVTVYVTSRPQDPQSLLVGIQASIEVIFQGWRDWRCVLFGKKLGEQLLRRNLFDGSGLLLPGAPASVAKAVIDACSEHGASTYFQGDIENTAPVSSAYQLLLIGDGYVIAKDFRFVQL